MCRWVCNYVTGKCRKGWSQCWRGRIWNDSRLSGMVNANKEWLNDYESAMTPKKDMTPLFSHHFLTYSFQIYFYWIIPFNVFSRAKDVNSRVVCNFKIKSFRFFFFAFQLPFQIFPLLNVLHVTPTCYFFNYISPSYCFFSWASLKSPLGK